jgi:hypothetical protein
MKIFQDSIDQQFEFNKGKNLFYHGIIGSLKFSPATVEAIDKIDLIDTDSKELLIDYLTNTALQAFCELNQYYTFDTLAKQALRELYTDLFENIKSHRFHIDAIAEKHYEHVIKWLQETNSFAEKIYASKGETLGSVACSEYSSELQIEILQLDINSIACPVLDIGCGKEGSLVKYLRQHGIEAYGFDRFADDATFLWKSDWFEYKFEKDKWGTITSNLGFSNHFQHHHFRNDGNFIEYAKKYMEILASLKLGGCFRYAPDLPFVEMYLDEDKFRIMKHKVGSYHFKSVIVQRLK